MKPTLTRKAILKSNELSEFEGKKCLLTVSVGQPNHESDKFFASVLATTKHFTSCTIMVCDSLQRYTMKISSPANLNELHTQSNQLGKEWIARNALALGQFTIPYTLSHWDEWITHNEYLTKKDIIDTYYAKDPLFKSSVDTTAINFSERKSELSVVDASTAFELSKEYLLEECAVMLLQADEGFPFEIYPSQRNEAMDYVYRHIISYTNRELMRAVSIKFKKLTPAS